MEMIHRSKTSLIAMIVGFVMTSLGIITASLFGHPLTEIGPPIVIHTVLEQANVMLRLLIAHNLYARFNAFRSGLNLMWCIGMWTSAVAYFVHMLTPIFGELPWLVVWSGATGDLLLAEFITLGIVWSRVGPPRVTIEVIFGALAIVAITTGIVIATYGTVPPSLVEVGMATRLLAATLALVWIGISAVASRSISVLMHEPGFVFTAALLTFSSAVMVASREMYDLLFMATHVIRIVALGGWAARFLWAQSVPGSEGKRMVSRLRDLAMAKDEIRRIQDDVERIESGLR